MNWTVHLCIMRFKNTMLLLFTASILKFSPRQTHFPVTAGYVFLSSVVKLPRGMGSAVT